MTLPDHIPVFLLSGFLGSGKTTLLNELLRDSAFGDTAVIINEFGDVPVDHLLVREGETAISQVSTGCLCCSGTTDLRTTLFDLHRAGLAGLCPPFSRVIVEMSGLGDPAPLVNALAGAEAPPTPFTLHVPYTQRDQTVDATFFLAGIVTLFDVLAGKVALENHFEAVKQIAFADRIVLTKTDLAEQSAAINELALLPTELTKLNAGALVVDRSKSDLSDLFVERRYAAVDRGEDVAGWLALEAVLAAETAQHEPTSSESRSSLRHGSGIRTFSIVREAPISDVKFRQFLDLLQTAAGPKLLRVKGIIWVEDDLNRPRVVHAVQHIASKPQFLDGWPDGGRSTRLVFITNDIDPEHVRTIFTSLIDDHSFSVSDAIDRLTDHVIAPAWRHVKRQFSSQRTSA